MARHRDYRVRGITEVWLWHLDLPPAMPDCEPLRVRLPAVQQAAVRQGLPALWIATDVVSTARPTLVLDIAPGSCEVMDMEAGAYRQLDQLGLPRPQSWDPSELWRIPESHEWLYVRAPNGHPMRGPHRRLELLAREPEFQRLINAPEAQLDEIVDSSFGCVLVSSTDAFYIEFVKGHLSGLLVHAQLFGRYRIARHDNARVLSSKLELQVREARLIDGRLTYHPLKSTFDRNELFEIGSRQISPYLPRVPTGLLVEIMFKRAGGPVFVDIKSYAWSIDYTALFQGSQGAVLYGKRRDGEVYEGPHHPSAVERLGHDAEIPLGRNPLLSHFITYALRFGIRAIYV